MSAAASRMIGLNFCGTPPTVFQATPHIVKRLLITVALLTLAVPRCPALEWLTDVPAALARAKAENKTVLLDFTGSDWCGWCMRLKAEVFDQPEFSTYAHANLILVELDFPHHKTQS